jgi:hypothetical protein
MTNQEEKAALKKRLEAHRDKENEKADLRTRLEEARNGEREPRADLKKRLEEARNKKTPEPVKERGYGPTGIFPLAFMDRCAKLYRDKLITFVEQWDDVAHDYLDWLEAEGFTPSESSELLNEALVKADLDMGKFPACG